MCRGGSDIACVFHHDVIFPVFCCFEGRTKENLEDRRSLAHHQTLKMLAPITSPQQNRTFKKIFSISRESFIAENMLIKTGWKDDQGNIYGVKAGKLICCNGFKKRKFKFVMQNRNSIKNISVAQNDLRCHPSVATSEVEMS